MSENDQLADALAESINKDSDHKVAYFLDDEDSPSEVDHWVSTGSTILDMKISNREDGGLPVGKICEIHGPEASGKSLLAAHVLANTQKKGGVPVYIDTENAVNFDFLKTIGIDEEGDFLYVSENKIEKIFEIIEKIIVKVREESDGDDGRFVTILVDSVAGATTEKEAEGNFDKDGYNTDKAIVLSKSMRKLTNTFGREEVLILFTNQIRANVGGGMFAPDWTVPGGHAIPFHSSVRLRMRNTSKIKEGTGSSKRVVGAKLKPVTYKNRLAPPQRSCDFDLYFDSGIDDIGSIKDELSAHNIIKHKGAGWYHIPQDNEDSSWSHPDEDGDDEFTFRGKNFDDLWRNDSVFQQKLFGKLTDAVLVDYEDDWVDRSEVEYVEEDDEYDDLKEGE